MLGLWEITGYAVTASVSALVGHFWKRLLRIQRPLVKSNGDLMSILKDIRTTQIRHGHCVDHLLEIELDKPPRESQDRLRKKQNKRRGYAAREHIEV